MREEEKEEDGRHKYGKTVEWESKRRRKIDDNSRGRRWSGRVGEGGILMTTLGEDGGVGE